MVSKEYTEVILGRQRLIAMDVLDSEEEAEYSSINHDGDALNEEYGSGLVGSGATEEVEDMHKDVKYSSILSHMLKPSN